MRRHVGLLRLLQEVPRVAAAPHVFSCASSVQCTPISAAPGRFLYTQRSQDEGVETLEPTISTLSAVPVTATAPIAESSLEESKTLRKRVMHPSSSYREALRAFNELRSRGEKLDENKYLSLLYKASREGRYKRVRECYKAFQEDERLEQVKRPLRSPSTWPKLSFAKLNMHRFVLWTLLDEDGELALAPFYQQEVVGKPNALSIHEADPLNFLLHMECQGRVGGEEQQGLRQRVEILLRSMEHIEYRTSYSAAHAFFRLILHRPDIFLKSAANRQNVEEQGAEVYGIKKYDAGAAGNLIIEYMDRFPYALALEPKRLSIAASAAAAAGQHDAAILLLEHAAKNRVPIDSGSFAHTVESAPNDACRMKAAGLYMHAKERDLVYTTQDADASIVNYLLLLAVFDGNFKHIMELLHEMQLYNNKISNRTVKALFNSIAKYRATIRRSLDPNNKIDMSQKLAECPTIADLFAKFPNVIPCTVYAFSEGIRYSLFGGDLDAALEIMRAALWTKDVKLRPEIYSQLLYPLLAGGQRGGDEANDVSVFDRLVVERSFDRQYPGKRSHLNSIILNICQANDDFSTMLVCLDRWQTQRHPALSRRAVQRVFDVISKQIQQLQEGGEEFPPSTDVIADGVKLSYLSILERYHGVIIWDAWTIGTAVIRSGMRGLQADVIALMAEADARDLVLDCAAYSVLLSVLEAADEPSAVIACAEKMKANGVWEKTANKYPQVQDVLDRAVVERGVSSPSDEEY
ncbi:hypothetical protein PHYBOEH_006309 [Phytophthora boehmeriae]|uniref:Mitochondrial protein n=1 Tax=Phytophthora boehmeriae TaxID=109152 RepID=A0A8T1WEX7_9STRA|nr:hypothetical protein PHYBOEH_006309 [Phytophthora boehmeriae]